MVTLGAQAQPTEVVGTVKSKTFDCVEMNHRIQESILKELADLSPAERRGGSEQAAG